MARLYLNLFEQAIVGPNEKIPHHLVKDNKTYIYISKLFIIQLSKVLSMKSKKNSML